MSHHAFNLRGDIPDRALMEAYGNGEILRVTQLVPNTASTRATLEKMGTGYSAAAEVQLLGGATLFSHADANSPKEAIRMAISKIEGRIGKWQGARSR